MPQFDGIEAQQTTDINVGQTRAAEIVHVPNRAAQKRCHLIHRPQVFEAVGNFDGDFHAHGIASTRVDGRQMSGQPDNVENDTVSFSGLDLQRCDPRIPITRVRAADRCRKTRLLAAPFRNEPPLMPSADIQLRFRRTLRLPVIIAAALPTAIAFTGCEVLDPPRATTLSALPTAVAPAASPSHDTFEPLSLPYPAAKIAERSQVPVGDYLRAAFRKAIPSADVSVRAWQPSAEVKGTLGPHVVMNLGFEFLVRINGAERRVADFLSTDLGAHHVSHLSITGLHSVDSHEIPGPIHDQLRSFLDTVVEKVKWRLRE